MERLSSQFRGSYQGDIPELVKRATGPLAMTFGRGKLVRFVFPAAPVSNSNADAHRGDEKRFVVPTDEMLTAFLELERAVR